MELLDFLKSMPVQQRKSFADHCGTTIGHINNVAYGLKPCREKLAISIERESGGKVRCETLRPDVDWSYIRGTKKASKEVAA